MKRTPTAIAAAAALSAPAAVAQTTLYSNGPFITHPGQGAGGADASVIPQGVTSFGYSCNLLAPDHRLADNFTVPAGGWTISSIVFYGFQSGAPTSPPTIHTARLRIWHGRPGDPNATILFGNLTDNRLLSAAWADAYRVRSTEMASTQRAIYRVEATVNPPLSLQPGEYWLEWQAGGTLPSGPFCVPVSYPGLPGPPNADARFFDGATWSNLREGTTQAPQDLAFEIRGTAGAGGPACYANCDGSTSTPILNVNDFICFQTRFAAGDTAANCDGSTAAPLLNVNDFICFQTRFAAGCSAP